MKKTESVLCIPEENRYSDLLLVDLLDLDKKRFWVRYKIDVFGFLGVMIVTLLMIGLLALIAQIGS